MAPRIADPKLLADLLADLERLATMWKLEGAGTPDEEKCRARAAVLEEYAHALEHAAMAAPTFH